MENQLEVIVKESGLEQSKAKFILENFQNYFEIADEWANKAKTIKVTDASQKADMEIARVGRLFLREKRIVVENSRKQLKEQALREGKAIDGIANVLKALIVPIEEYLEKQEKFVELKEEAEKEAKRIEIERRMEEEELVKQKAYAEEQERIRQENEKLKKEAEAKEKALQAERAKVEAEKQEAERKARAEQDRLKKEAEAKLAEERKSSEAKRKAEQDKTFAEAERIRKVNEAKLAKERAEREKLEAELKNQIECPKCHHKFKLNEK